MDDVVHVDEASFNLHLTRQFGRARRIYFHLPSHSPFFNVAERTFKHIKRHVRRGALQNHQTLLLHINDVIHTSNHNKHGARLDKRVQ
jgi:transposase